MSSSFFFFQRDCLRVTISALSVLVLCLFDFWLFTSERCAELGCEVASHDAAVLLEDQINLLTCTPSQLMMPVRGISVFHQKKPNKTPEPPCDASVEAL